LGEYASVPSRFVVAEELALLVPQQGLAGLHLVPQAVDSPYTKDYDSYPGNYPPQWAERFEVSRWGFFAARFGEERVGGAALAWRSPDVDLLEGRLDLAVLWDLRVAAAAQRRGVGSALFRAAEEWAASQGAVQLKVETQNVNVVACRFYQRQGCTLGAINRFAYSDLPDEVQLLWYKDLPRAAHGLPEPERA
jgi:GNAT superfamily N-acetyltransferase